MSGLLMPIWIYPPGVSYQSWVTTTELCRHCLPKIGVATYLFRPLRQPSRKAPIGASGFGLSYGGDNSALLRCTFPLPLCSGGPRLPHRASGAPHSTYTPMERHLLCSRRVATEGIENTTPRDTATEPNVRRECKWQRYLVLILHRDERLLSQNTPVVFITCQCVSGMA